MGQRRGGHRRHGTAASIEFRSAEASVTGFAFSTPFTLASYLIEGQLTTGQYFLFLARDIATAVGFIVARFIPGLTIASFRARLLGKAVTVLQLAALIAVLILPSAVQALVVLIGSAAFVVGSFFPATLAIGAVIFALAALSLLSLRETYGVDLDYAER